MSRIAIIDLGTNTFNLLIVEAKIDKTYRQLFQTKISVKLGEGGINKGFLAPVPFQRGIDAINVYKKIIDDYQVDDTLAIATSAVRDAANGKEFTDRIQQESGIEVKIISGEEEAELIYIGVREAVKMNDENSLVIDIGGGSTEFIIANRNQVCWKQSFLLGAARLLEKINPSDPISENEIQTLEEYLKKELQPLFEALRNYPVMEIVGSSGSFDSLVDMILQRFYSKAMPDEQTEHEIDLNDFNVLYHDIIKSTKEERMQMKGLIMMRVDMIVVSSILLNFVIQSLNIKKIRSSTYSLKEGVLHQVLYENFK
jgi:exopolyphosphatase/guanosine-5'-triphosphate,3'-diphosphate pyrophosphatase